MNCKLKVNYKEDSYILILPFIITFVYLFFGDKKGILSYNRSNFKFWQIEHAKQIFTFMIIIQEPQVSQNV